VAGVALAEHLQDVLIGRVVDDLCVERVSARQEHVGVIGRTDVC
jgi:hypothetical protein